MQHKTTKPSRPALLVVAFVVIGSLASPAAFCDEQQDDVASLSHEQLAPSRVPAFESPEQDAPPPMFNMETLLGKSQAVDIPVMIP